MKTLKTRRLQLRHDQTTLLWAAVACLLAMFVPVIQLIGIPLEYLNAHTHEMCHAIAAVLTGGSVQHIIVFSDASGVTPIYGGMLPIIGSAGYVGASIIGVLLILSSRTPKGARRSLRILAGALTLSMLIWVRGDTVGVVSGMVWIAALFAAASYLPERGVLFTATFLGLEQCLHSIQSLLTLTNISLFTHQHSDAALLQQSTGLSAAFWAVGWTAFSGLLVFTALRGAFSKRA